MRHLTDDTDVFNGYVAKPGDYGYFDWDKVIPKPYECLDDTELLATVRQQIDSKYAEIEEFFDGSPHWTDEEKESILSSGAMGGGQSYADAQRAKFYKAIKATMTPEEIAEYRRKLEERHCE